MEVPWGKGILGHVAETGDTINLTSAYQVSPGVVRGFSRGVRRVAGVWVTDVFVLSVLMCVCV